MKTYIVMTTIMGRVRIQAESFHASSDAKLILFMSKDATVALFPAEQVVGVIDEPAFVSDNLTES